MKHKKQKDRSGLILLGIFGVVALIAVVVIVLSYVQSINNNELIYDVLNAQGQIVGYVVGDNVFLHQQDYMTGSVVYTTLTTSNLPKVYPTYTLQPRVTTDLNINLESLDGGDSWN